MSGVRRTFVVTLFAILALVLVQDIRNEVPAVDETLENVLGPSLGRIPLDPGLVTGLLVVGFAAAAATVAMLGGDRGPGVLAVVTAGTLTWLTFPFAHLTWLAPFVGGQVQTYTPSALAWIVSGGLVVLTVVEALASTRDMIVRDLQERGVSAEDAASVARGTAASMWTIGLASLVLAVPAALATAGAFGQMAIPLRVDLVLVPAGIGVLLGAYLWWASRTPRAGRGPSPPGS